MRILTYILSFAFVIAIAFLSPATYATPDDQSWQKQILLAATVDKYLVLETNGHFKGWPPQTKEMVRYVVYSSKTNEELSQSIVRETLTVFSENSSETTILKSESESPLSEVLRKFNGRIPTPTSRITKRFVSADNGLYVIDEGNRTLVFTADEISSRSYVSDPAVAMHNLKVIGLQQIKDLYFLTLHSGVSREEIVMSLLR